MRSIPNPFYFSLLASTILFAALFAVVEFAVLPADAADSARAGWRMLKPMPTPSVFSAGSVGPDGRVFIFSGSLHYDGGLTNATRIYDPQIDSWSEGAPVPIPSSSPASALGPDGNIYLIGGQLPGATRKATAVNHVYNWFSNTWTQQRPMSSPRMGHCAVSAKGAGGRELIYVIGGRDFIDPMNGLATVEAYDCVRDEWEAMAPMPTPRHALAACLGADGKIYAIGGANHRDGFTTALEVYDPLRNSWINEVPLAAPIECASLVALPAPDGRLLLIGGWPTLDKVSSAAFVSYDPIVHGWKSLPQMPVATAAECAMLVKTPLEGDVVFVFDGAPGDDAAEKYVFTR